MNRKLLLRCSDNLYLDELKERITESDYDRFYQSLKDQSIDITVRLEQLQEAEDNYYLATKCLLGLANRALELFTSSEVEEKRQVMKLILSNVRIEAGKVLYDVQTPFDMILKCSDRQQWRYLVDAFRREISFRPSKCTKLSFCLASNN